MINHWVRACVHRTLDTSQRWTSSAVEPWTNQTNQPIKPNTESPTFVWVVYFVTIFAFLFLSCSIPYDRRWSIDWNEHLVITYWNQTKTKSRNYWAIKSWWIITRLPLLPRSPLPPSLPGGPIWPNSPFSPGTPGFQTIQIVNISKSLHKCVT